MAAAVRSIPRACWRVRRQPRQRPAVCAVSPAIWSTAMPIDAGHVYRAERMGVWATSFVATRRRVASAAATRSGARCNVHGYGSADDERAVTTGPTSPSRALGAAVTRRSLERLQIALDDSSGAVHAVARIDAADAIPRPRHRWPTVADQRWRRRRAATSYDGDACGWRSMESAVGAADAGRGRSGASWASHPAYPRRRRRADPDGRDAGGDRRARGRRPRCTARSIPDGMPR